MLVLLQIWLKLKLSGQENSFFIGEIWDSPTNVVSERAGEVKIILSDYSYSPSHF